MITQRMRQPHGTFVYAYTQQYHVDGLESEKGIGWGLEHDALEAWAEHGGASRDVWAAEADVMWNPSRFGYFISWLICYGCIDTCNA